MPKYIPLHGDRVCRVARIENGTTWCRVAGLSQYQGPYKIGDQIAVDSDKVRGAI